MQTVALTLALLAIFGYSRASIDVDKAAEISREIREHFRRTGANWVSPRMFQQLNLTHNSKPIMFLYTSRSCADCREFMQSWGRLDRVKVSSVTAQFLSVLVLDDYMFEMARFSPEEADYLPRVLFADSNGRVRLEFTNSHMSPPSQYFYSTADEVVNEMSYVLARHWEDLGTDVFRGDLEADLP